MALVWPVKFVCDVPRDKPTPFTLRGRDYVLWWADEALHCAPNRCPHRSATLSTGTVRNEKLVCGYHSWEFAGDGRCTRIPQLRRKAPFPRACDLKTLETTVSDGIVWVKEGEGPAVGTPTSLLTGLGPYDVVSDASMRMKNSYRLQVENALDVAHLHTVHDGFQGSASKLSPIRCSWFHEDDAVIGAYFEHDSSTPDMEILLLKPGTVVVKVIDKVTKRRLRTNIINVSPETDTSCNVLFRDVAQYDGIVYNHAAYRFVNAFIIAAIFKQDVAVMSGQQKNAAYLTYCMPAPADRGIVAFKRWCHVSNLM